MVDLVLDGPGIPGRHGPALIGSGPEDGVISARRWSAGPVTSVASCCAWCSAIRSCDWPPTTSQPARWPSGGRRRTRTSRGHTDLAFSSPDQLGDYDVLLLATGHAETMRRMPDLPRLARW